MLAWAINPTMAEANMGHETRSDSVLYYKNGKDSLRISYKNGKIFRELFYYPDGNVKHSVITLKNKSGNGRVHKKTVKVYTTWDESGKVVKKKRVKMKNFVMGGKDISWIFVENGKRRLKRDKKVIGTKL
jgi:antitoxin component YwqK of YwqJK toxin-antitoxin module